MVCNVKYSFKREVFFIKSSIYEWVMGRSLFHLNFKSAWGANYRKYVIPNSVMKVLVIRTF